MTPERLRDLRKQSGMTQQQLADAVGYSMDHYSKLERGKSPLPIGFYLRAVKKMLKHTQNNGLILQNELQNAVCQEEGC